VSGIPIEQLIHVIAREVGARIDGYRTVDGPPPSALTTVMFRATEDASRFMTGCVARTVAAQQYLAPDDGPDFVIILG
jgi:hypothetical protein